MPSKIASLVGYTRVPAAKYMIRHPVKGTKALMAAKGAKGLVTTRAGAVLSGLLAVPLGLFFLRRRGNSEEL